MGKKVYERPVLAFERFVPNEFVANCFTYRANLECSYGAWHKLHDTNNSQPTTATCWEGGTGRVHHGAACAESSISVTVRNKEITMVGTEGADKTMVNLIDVDIEGVDQVSEVGQRFEDCKWVSKYAGLTYNHVGSGVVTYFSRQANAS